MTQDARSGKVILVAHCILNQNSRVLGLSRYPAVVSDIVDTLTKHNIGVVQMPCPEISFIGLKRIIQTKEQYDTPKFRRHCGRIANSLANEVQEYLQNDVKVLAILGVEGSPSCGATEISGILIEELKSELKRRRINVPFHELKFEEIRASMESLEKIVKT